LKPAFVDLLACPKCGSSFELMYDGHSAEVDSGQLVCRDHHQFEITGGVPRFVDSELYAQNFGFEWNVHSLTQLDNARSDESERTFRAKTGFAPEDLHGKRVLDVGCGMGRFSDVAARWGATVVGIDLSTAVDAAQRNIGSRPNVHIAQANIFELPLRAETFDFIFSIGVLHHTPNTRAAFDKLPRLLRNGGRIAIWLYEKHPLKWRFSDLYRRFTPRLPKRVLYRLSYGAIPLYFTYKIPIVGLAIHWVLPAGDHPKSTWRVLDTFDWYSPQYQWKHSYGEVLGWFEEHDLTDVRVLDVPVAIQGTRRAVGDQMNPASQASPPRTTSQ